jgi:DNA-directed RNA polymerase specialized sigma24 family protein
VNEERSGEFEAAVAALLDDFAAEGTFAEAEMKVVLGGLSRYLRATVGGLSHDDLTEVIDVALLEFLEAAHAGRVERKLSPGGLLIRLARWRALDFLRQRATQAEPVVELEEEEGVDMAAEVIEALSSEEVVDELLRLNRDQGRDDLNAVIRAFLDLADLGEKTTFRAVAAKLGLAPSTVSSRLAEIRDILGGGDR